MPLGPESAEYVAALAGDVAAQLGPEAVDLEAGFHPAWEPAYTLTLSLEPLSERARLLAAQCFCESCRALLGTDAEARARAAAGPPFGDGTDDGSILEELAAARASAARLLGGVAASVHGEGASFASSSPARPSRRPCRVWPRTRSPPPMRSSSAAGRSRATRSKLASPAFAPWPAAPARSRRTGRPSVRSSLPTSSVWRQPEPRLSLYNLSLVPDAGLEAFRIAAQAFRGAVHA